LKYIREGAKVCRKLATHARAGYIGCASQPKPNCHPESEGRIKGDDAETRTAGTAKVENKTVKHKTPEGRYS